MSLVDTLKENSKNITYSAMSFAGVANLGNTFLKSAAASVPPQYQTLATTAAFLITAAAAGTTAFHTWRGVNASTSSAPSSGPSNTPS